MFCDELFIDHISLSVACIYQKMDAQACTPNSPPEVSFQQQTSRHAMVWVTKKFPFFETRYRATVILRSVFVSVPFYNFPCFYCCVSILKVRREEWLKNGKKNGAKNGNAACFFHCPFSNSCTSLLLYLDKNFKIPR